MARPHAAESPRSRIPGDGGVTERMTEGVTESSFCDFLETFSKNEGVTEVT